jgi:hypothetical protein|tara:strand:- start:930 stop:1382 length:453 start_codon:yes stop_codon:yes gene_type:complete
MAIYGSIAEADTYFLTKRLDFDDLWAEENDTNKAAALEMATAAIENMNFTGSRNDAAQALEFPRGTDLVVPDEIKNACYECARAFLDGIDPEMEGELETSVSATIGPVRERKVSNRIAMYRKHGIPSIVAWRLLFPFLRDGQAINFSRTP